MKTLKFTGLGTSWAILIDEDSTPKTLEEEIGNQISTFEKKYSRFLPDSELSQINQSPNNVQVSSDLKKMLEIGLELHKATDGFFDLNIASLISGLGYDQNYSFTANQSLVNKPRGHFSLHDNTLIREGNVQIDLGSIGKGFLIDQIAHHLREQGIHHYLVDGGGDIFCSQKRDNSPWSVALEHPLHQEQAVAVIPLRNQGIATSSPQKRRFNDSHHLLNPKANSSTSTILSVTTLASSATFADVTATAIFVSPKQYWSPLSKITKVEYYATDPNFSQLFSEKFPDLSF